MKHRSPTLAAGALLALAFLPVELPAVIPTGAVAIYSFTGNANDSVGTKHATVVNATLTSSRRPTSPNGSRAYSFNGTNAYLEISDNDIFSISTANEFSISIWMMPTATNFADTESTADPNNLYIHWVTKGTVNGASGNQEWLLRLYNGNAVDRSYRTSAYGFNREGGLGNGTFVQDGALPQTTWTHFVAVFKKDGTYPDGDYIKIYKGGALKNTHRLSVQTINGQPNNVNVTNQNAPVRIGRGMSSYFKGRLDDIVIYNRVLSAAEVIQLRDDIDMW
jgi:hypothetical protein